MLAMFFSLIKTSVKTTVIAFQKIHNKANTSLVRNFIVKRQLSYFFLILSFGASFVTLPIQAINLLPGNNVYHPRAMAMGNAFHAIADDEFALFSNPAGLMHNPKFGQEKNNGILSIFEITVKINKDLETLSSFYEDNKDSLSNPSSLSTEKLDSILGLKAGIGAQGPLNIGYIGKNWGVALIDTVDIQAIVGRDAPVPLLHLNAVAHTTLVGGYALPLSLTHKNDLWVGANAKLFYRGDIDKKLSVFDLEKIEEIKDEFFFGTGIGIDIGLIYRLSQDWNMSFSIQDAPTVVTKSFWGTFGFGSNRDATALIKPNFAIGFAYRPEIHFLHKYVPEWIIDKPVLSFDYAHILDSNYSLFTRIHFGAEFAALFHRLYIRFGLNQGYPTYGLGFDLYFFRMDYVYYRRELGVYPGDLVEESSIFSISGKF